MSARKKDLEGPVISIIIPIYGVEEYLRQCLESVVSQDYENFEVIGVDDDSPDNSADIFMKYVDDDRFKLLRHQENLGLPSARNTGLFAAKGDYIYFLDSDDWIAPQALSTLLSLAQEDSVDIAIGGMIRCDEDTGRAHVPGNHGLVMKLNARKLLVHDEPRLFASVTSTNKLISKDFLQRSGLIFRAFPRRFEDMVTYKWYLSGATVSTTEIITYFYRRRSSESIQPSITQGNDLPTLSDRFLAYKDLAAYVLTMDLFMSDVDPMHSAHSSVNLRQAIENMSVRLLLLASSTDSASPERSDLLTCVSSAKGLYDILPATYIDSLPKKLQYMAFVLTDSSIEFAASKFCSKKAFA